MEAETDIASFLGGREAAAIAGFREGGRGGGRGKRFRRATNERFEKGERGETGGTEAEHIQLGGLMEERGAPRGIGGGGIGSTTTPFTRVRILSSWADYSCKPC